MSPTDPSKRTEYSKSGCKECKRRKIKCDEFINPPPEARLLVNHQNKRSCWQCTRLKKICEYPMKGEKVLRVSKKKQQESIGSQNSLPSRSSTSSSSASGSTGSAGNKSSISSFSEQIQKKPQIPSTHFQVLTKLAAFDGSVHIPNQINPFPMATIPSNTPSFGYLQKGPNFSHLHAKLSGPDYIPPVDPSAVLPDKRAFAYPQGSTDLAVLAYDLNNLVNDMMHGTIKGNSAAGNNTAFDSTHTSPSIDGEFLQCHSHFKASDTAIPKNIGLDIFNVSLEAQIYLKEFYDEFSNVIMPFTAFDRMTQSHFNPVRDILFYHASSEPFLLAAILAQGASSRYQKSKYIGDDQAYHKYLSKCLKLLGAALGRSSDKRSLSSLGNIEPVLLAVLLLTSSNAANTNQHWRPHLQGAKGILLRHSTLQKNMKASTTILLCKCWFVSFEILAGLGSKLGGTLDSEEDLEVLLHFDGSDFQLLESMGLVLSNGYFLIGGYHIDLIPTFKGLIKQLNKYRKNQNHVFDETSEYIRLLADFERFRLFEFVHRKAVLSSDDFLGGYIPPGYLLDPVTVDNTRHVLSWMDTSHQVYCLAGLVTVMTELLGMSHASPQVQSMAKDLQSFASVLCQFSKTPSLIKCSVMMIQWPMIVAGFNSIRSVDQENVIKFFEAARSVGAGSADHFIARLRSSWLKEGARSMFNFDDNIDAVTY